MERLRLIILLLLINLVGKSQALVNPFILATTEVGGLVTIEAFDGKAGNSQTSHTLNGVPAGALLVVATNSAWCASADATISSSPSLTWTKRVDAYSGCGNSEIWTAVYTGGGSITITSNWGSTYQSSVAYQVKNQEATLGGNTATGLSQDDANVNITTTKANSIIICSSVDWDGSSGARSYRGIPIESFYDANAGTAIHYYYSAVTVGAYNVGYTSPSGIGASVTAVYELRGN